MNPYETLPQITPRAPLGVAPRAALGRQVLGLPPTSARRRSAEWRQVEVPFEDPGGCRNAQRLLEKLDALPGVQGARPGSAGKAGVHRVRVTYSPDEIDLMVIVACAHTLGYTVPTATTRLTLEGLNERPASSSGRLGVCCMKDIAEALYRLPGVLWASVNEKERRISVDHIPDLMPVDEFPRTIEGLLNGRMAAFSPLEGEAEEFLPCEGPARDHLSSPAGSRGGASVENRAGGREASPRFAVAGPVPDP